ncbi:MAG TPA: hypothetical protein VMC10_12175 [Stellaceae bacterium]|nr:hypothetical protein [Stellaceae bacterium]
MKHLAVTVAAALTLAACANYSLVSPSRQVVQGRLAVETGIAWNKVNKPSSESIFYSVSGPVETWTVDGESLDAVAFFAGIPDGVPLVVRQNKTQSIGAFRSSMTPNDIMDLTSATLATLANTAVIKSRDLRPAKVAGLDGFRFEIDYALHDDIDRVLSAAGVVRDGKLYLIVFEGASIYYYGKYLPEFERIVTSASFVGT